MQDCCEKCSYWRLNKRAVDIFPSEGKCQRYAPAPFTEHMDKITISLTGEDSRSSGVYWPTTLGEDWCGDYLEKAVK